MEAKKKQTKGWAGKVILCRHERRFKSFGAPCPHVLLVSFYLCAESWPCQCAMSSRFSYALFTCALSPMRQVCHAVDRSFQRLPIKAPRCNMRMVGASWQVSVCGKERPHVTWLFWPSSIVAHHMDAIVPLDKRAIYYHVTHKHRQKGIRFMSSVHERYLSLFKPRPFCNHACRLDIIWLYQTASIIQNNVYFPSKVGDREGKGIWWCGMEYNRA